MQREDARRTDALPQSAPLLALRYSCVLIRHLIRLCDADLMDLTDTDPEIECLIAEALTELREMRREAAQPNV